MDTFVALTALGLGAAGIYFFTQRKPKSAPKTKKTPPPQQPQFAPVTDLRTKAVPLDTQTLNTKQSVKLTPTKRQTDEDEAGSRERFYGGY